MDQQLYDEYEAQSALQAEGIEKQVGMMYPEYQEVAQQAQAVLLTTLNPKNDVDRILLQLQGLEKTPDGKTIQIGEPQVNLNGIQDIRNILAPLVNQSNEVSDQEEDQVKQFMEEFLLHP